jgi:hypothetical protein
MWLAMLATAGLKAMEPHTSEYVGNAVLFRFELANGMSPAISLPNSEPEVPPARSFSRNSDSQDRTSRFTGSGEVGLISIGQSNVAAP